MVQINYRDPRPIYEQLRDGFRQLILTGVLEPGSKLPSVRELAAKLAPTPSSAPIASWRPRAASPPPRGGGASYARRTRPNSPGARS